MKKNITFLLSLLLIACSEQEEMKDVSSYLELSVNSLLFDSDGGTKEIVVESDMEWKVSALPPWVSIANQTAQSVSFIATKNETEDARSCQILFSTAQNETNCYVKQSAKGYLSFASEKDLKFTSEKEQRTIKVKQNIPFKIKYLDEGETWLLLSLMAGDAFFRKDLSGMRDILSLQVKENQSQDDRMAKIVICNDSCSLSDTLSVTQTGRNIGRKYADGEYIRLQQASEGNVELIVMGDGFLLKDLNEGGTYELAMRDAVEYFFSIEPYKSYRDYFNVNMVIAESKCEGVGQKNSLGLTTFQNKFGSAFGSGTEIVCNDKLVLEYARKVKEIPDGKPLTVIVVLNSSKYAGTTYLYSDGNSIALCPMSTEEPPNNFEGLIHHEAGGHGFGFLCDEYVYYQKAIPESRKQEIKEWQEYGFQMNLDFTDDISTILWKGFIGMDKYKHVGAYEGGYEYQYDVWRSEENSCMNNNIPYFNVQSRWAIVNRIMKLATKDFTIQDFIQTDVPALPDAATRSMTGKSFRPLGEPIWIKK